MHRRPPCIRKRPVAILKAQPLSYVFILAYFLIFHARFRNEFVDLGIINCNCVFRISKCFRTKQSMPNSARGPSADPSPMMAFGNPYQHRFTPVPQQPQVLYHPSPQPSVRSCFTRYYYTNSNSEFINVFDDSKTKN